MERTKIETFLGFALRSRNIRCGFNAVETLKKANLIIVCNSASLNTQKQSEKLAKKFNCTIIKTTMLLEDLLHKSGIKVVAITNIDMANAILSDKKNYTALF